MSGWYWHPHWSWLLLAIAADATVILQASYWQNFLNAGIDADFEDIIRRAEKDEGELEEVRWSDVFETISPAFQRFFSANTNTPQTLSSAAKTRVRVFVYRPRRENPFPAAELAYMAALRTAYVVVADDPRCGIAFARFKLFHELAHTTALSVMMRARIFVVPMIVCCLAISCIFSRGLSLAAVAFATWAIGASWGVIIRHRDECEGIADAFALGMLACDQERKDVAAVMLLYLQAQFETVDTNAKSQILQGRFGAPWARIFLLARSKLYLAERMRLFQTAAASPELFYPRTPRLKAWSLPGVAWLVAGAISAYFLGSSMTNAVSATVGMIALSLVAAKLQSWGPRARLNAVLRDRGRDMDRRIDTLMRRESAD